MSKHEKLEREIKIARSQNISWDRIETQLFLKLGADTKLRKYFNITEPRELGMVIDNMKKSSLYKTFTNWHYFKSIQNLSTRSKMLVFLS